MPASASSTPASFACRVISVSHHLRALCADAPAATVCSIRSTAPALTTSRISSSVKPQSALTRFSRAAGGSGSVARSSSTHSRLGATGTRSGSGK